MAARRVVGWVLGGTVALAGWSAAGFGIVTATSVRQAAADDWNAGAISAAAPRAAAASATGMPATEPVADVGPKPPTETTLRLATASPPDPVDDGPKPPVRATEPPQFCVTDTCIDAYLWSLYARTPKIDTIRVTQQTKVTVDQDGKTRTITQTVRTFSGTDFSWKDPAAAQRSGMSLIDYVIGGMDQDFKLKLYRAVRAMDDAGLMPGITSGFRDDYRQSIAAGLKAAVDSSFHGGSRRGGYGHGLAVDLVSVKGETLTERAGASEELWKWIDAHEKEFGIGRPYRDRDPPHVGPIDGLEYLTWRGTANANRQALETRKATRPAATRQLVARNGSGAPKPLSRAHAYRLTSPKSRSIFAY